MARLRLYDLRISRLPQVLGLCADDLPRLSDAVNTAQAQLLYASEASDESWYGTFAEISFTVSRSQPYITLPREIARLEAVDVCDRPVGVNNQYLEFLQFGNGRLPKTWGAGCGLTGVYSRNNAVTMTDLSTPPQSIVVYATDASDIGKRVLVQGHDQNGLPIYYRDTFQTGKGVFMTLDTPFAVSPMTFNDITGIQKDVTTGPVQIFQFDQNTGASILLLTMAPGETVSGYRRYYFDSLPTNCCNGSGTETSVRINAIAKLDLIPVASDTDYLLLHNKEAIICQCQSDRYAEIDTPTAKSMAIERHKAAIRLLNGELSHYCGKLEPAVVFAPFGTARLQCQKIGGLL